MDINALREAVATATPGPWEYSGHDSGFDTVRAWPQLVVCDAMDNGCADATFIATFDPQMVGALLDIAQTAQAVARHFPSNSAATVQVDAIPCMDLARALDRLDRITA